MMSTRSCMLCPALRLEPICSQPELSYRMQYAVARLQQLDLMVTVVVICGRPTHAFQPSGVISCLSIIGTDQGIEALLSGLGIESTLCSMS